VHLYVRRVVVLAEMLYANPCRDSPSTKAS
jgi:hypothetical protein